MTTELFLKVRYAKDRSFASCWLIARRGAAEECLLYNDLTVAAARELAEALSLELIEEEWLVGCTPQAAPGCAELPAQQSLFEEIA